MADEEDESQQQPKRIKQFYLSNDRYSIPTLPQEIVIEILLRLTVKCLLCCKSVCKSWHSLIFNPYFVESHLSFSTINNDFAHHRLVLLDPDNNLNSCPLYDVMHDKPANPLELDFPLKDTWNVFEIVGSCNGLLCLRTGEDALLIWNPSTRKSNAVQYNVYKAQLYGFGYDESSQDYKVVVIYCRLQRTKVKMYSLKSAKWKKIGDFPHGITFGPDAYSNGALHWVTRPPFGPYSSPPTIVSLDLATEIYGEVVQPAYDEAEVDVRIKAFGERLFLVSTYWNHVDVWMMKVYGDPDSWTKLGSIRDQFRWSPAICFAAEEKILLKYDMKLVLYDVKKGSSSKVKNYSGSVSVFPWTIVESLVSPGGS